MTWLIKSDPDEYGWDELVQEKKATWTGVENPVAKKHLAAMKKGELVAFYHTGKEKQVVGIARVVAAGDPPTIAPVTAVAEKVGLAKLKEAKEFADSPLVKIGRLSVLPLTAAQWKALLALARTRL